MDISVLSSLVPNKVLVELPQTIERFGMETPVTLAHFLGQCHHESGGFKHVFENLNYSAQALLRVFPSRFKDPYEAEFFAHRPQHIANKIYASRMGNGGIPSGDGWNYRGRGYIQITGKSNYTRFDKEVPEDIVENPDLVATKYPLFSAGWFWSYRGVNKTITPKVITDESVMRVTKLVNGGTHGLQNRIDMTKKIFGALNG